MSVLSDIGACYRWVKAFAPNVSEADAFGFHLFRSFSFEQPPGCAYASFEDEHQQHHTFKADTLPEALAKAGKWARRQLEKDAARAKRERARGKR